MSALPRISQKLRYILTATIIGNTLEWYDFALFSILAPLLSKLFFPHDSSIHSLIQIFIFFAVGTLARPIGGLVFGYIGDRMGRKTALVYAIGLMTIPVGLIAALPSYMTIGIAAPLILAFICIFQGFCTGGEFAGSIVFLVESAPEKLKGFSGSWAYFGALLGMLLSSSEIYFVNQWVSPDSFAVWGWRIPFILGVIFGFTGFVLRCFLHETPLFEEAKGMGSIVKEPILSSLHKYKKQLLVAIALFVLDAVGFNLLIVFCSPYFSHFLGFSNEWAYTVNCLTVLTVLICIPIGGLICIRIGSKRVAQWAGWGMFFLGYPLYLALCTKNLIAIAIGQGGLAILLALYLSALPELISKLFPTQVRYSSVALAVNLSVAAFGGTAPLFNTYLINWMQDPAASGLYIICAALVSCWGLSQVKNTFNI